MNHCRKLLAECLGTFILVFAGCGAIMLHSLKPDVMPAHMIAVVFGLVVMALIYALGHISGAHFNPAVTLAFAVDKRFLWSEVLGYILSQCLGAIAAVAVLAVTLPETSTFGETLPNADLEIGVWQAFVWEFILTFMLMFVIISVATDSRAVGIMAGMAIGATVMLDAAIGGAFTGASMNPARSLGPALFAGNLEHLWLYWAAPIAGAIVAVVVYHFIRCEPELEKTEVKGCC